MTLWKTAIALGLAFALTACDAPTTLPAPGGYSASSTPVASRAARTPGTRSEVDIVRAVMSSL